MTDVNKAEILHSTDSRYLGRSSSNDFVSQGRILLPSTGRIYQGVSTVNVTNAQILALNATPVQIIAAPETNFAIVPYLFIAKHSGGTAYAGIAAGEDWVLKYTNASGAQVSSVMETTGFLDQTAAQIRVAGNPGATGTTAGDFAPLNAAVVLSQLSGEITTGNFDVLVRVFYWLMHTAFTA